MMAKYTLLLHDLTRRGDLTLIKEPLYAERELRPYEPLDTTALDLERHPVPQKWVKVGELRPGGVHVITNTQPLIAVAPRSGAYTPETLNAVLESIVEQSSFDMRLGIRDSSRTYERYIPELAQHKPAVQFPSAIIGDSVTLEVIPKSEQALLREAGIEAPQILSTGLSRHTWLRILPDPAYLDDFVKKRLPKHCSKYEATVEALEEYRAKS